MKIEIITGADNNPVAEFFSSSSTPETDAFTTSFTSIDDPEGNKRWVPSEFARVLERERDEARNISEKLSKQGLDMMDENRSLKRERDEAREKMADALQEVDLRTLDFERMKEERDDALSQIYQAECRAERFCQERDEARKTLGLA
jgi:regulator of replication initiation timing